MVEPGFVATHRDTARGCDQQGFGVPYACLHLVLAAPDARSQDFLQSSVVAKALQNDGIVGG